MFQSKYKKNNYKKGYTLLFSVLVSSLLLAVGISILNISKKEFLLATSARDSSSAFYAADSSIEYALYHDSLGDYDMAGQLTYTETVHIPTGSGGDSCAIVIINKTITSGTLTITFDSRGYNIGWDSVTSQCDENSPKRVERALLLTY